METKQQNDDIENLFAEIEKVLSRHGHSKEDIVCVLWGDDDCDVTPDISIGLGSFWEYAKNTNWDRNIWRSGPHFPMALLSGKGWWIEVVEYDSRTFLAYREEPKVKRPVLRLSENGNLKSIEKDEGKNT